jgi:hypothetical protein
MTSWQEAARRPRLTVASTFLLGLIGGGLIGYFRFGGLGWAVALGVMVALIVGGMTWRMVRDPQRVRELTERRRRPAIRSAVIRVVLPWAALGIATIAGVATHSSTVFAITFAAGLLATFVVRRFIPR